VLGAGVSGPFDTRGGAWRLLLVGMDYC